ncbi:hypothetical protein FCR2A7T_16540 [Flavobacterium cauense R2A-7]|nr:hypothetical protein FCR2A7T_16540 [Flavobacterium cauense R2A-7]
MLLILNKMKSKFFKNKKLTIRILLIALLVLLCLILNIYCIFMH